MLADSRYSCIILLNATQTDPTGVTEALALRRAKSLSLLPVCKKLFAVPLFVLGDCEELSDPIAGSITRLDVDTLALWRDTRFTDLLADANVRVVFLGRRVPGRGGLDRGAGRRKAWIRRPGLLGCDGRAAGS
ncbi:hypothetical protein V1280_000070 [Bradyrhizobium sp. AZCC 2230]